jgi:hypothetical protein
LSLTGPSVQLLPFEVHPVLSKLRIVDGFNKLVNDTCPTRDAQISLQWRSL